MDPSPPHAAPPVDVPREIPRLGGPGVFGVLSIIFGSLMLLMSLSGGCMMGCSDDMTTIDLMTKQVSAEKRVELRRSYETYRKAIMLPTIVSTVLFASLSGLLIFIGAGQLRRRRWACRATLWWSAAALATLAVSIVIYLLWTGPAMQQYTASQAAALTGAEAAAMKVTGQFGGVMIWITTLLEAPYPVIMAIYFGRARVREAMVA